MNVTLPRLARPALNERTISHAITAEKPKNRIAMLFISLSGAACVKHKPFVLSRD
jgi:hypothetical protein